MIAFKFLREGRVAPFARVAWPAPSSDTAWMRRRGPGRACDQRVHACRLDDLPEWIDAELWRVQLDGNVAVDCGKLVADRGRLLRRVEGWDGAAAAELATACTLRAREAALAMLGAGPQADALAAAPAGELQAVARAMAAGLDAVRERAASYVADAARHADLAVAEPATAPGHAAAAAFIAAHAAAFATDDVAAAGAERAWQARWMAERLALTS